MKKKKGVKKNRFEKDRFFIPFKIMMQYITKYLRHDGTEYGIASRVHDGKNHMLMKTSVL
jgi:hypothetical protein